MQGAYALVQSGSSASKPTRGGGSPKRTRSKTIALAKGTGGTNARFGGGRERLYHLSFSLWKKEKATSNK